MKSSSFRSWRITDVINSRRSSASDYPTFHLKSLAGLDQKDHLPEYKAALFVSRSALRSSFRSARLMEN